MKILLLFIVLVSCGKRDHNHSGNNCRSRESLIAECRAVNTPIYGRHYARDLCLRTHLSDECY